MYRIRSASGTEAVYHSLGEFSAAVHRGEVRAEDEIFHTRANRWLDVKSHPHYRSALDWSGPTSAPASPSPAPVPMTRPAPAVAPSPAPQARAQVFERPQVKVAPQTTLRPQLQAAPALKMHAPAPSLVAPTPSAPAPARPSGPAPKSRELNFVHEGNASPARATATAVEPPKQPTPNQVAVEAGPTELEFLVMDGGIESPVRSSSGHRTIPEDLNLLFDTPIEEAVKPLGGRVSTGKAPKIAAAPARPAPKAEVGAAHPELKPAAPGAPRAEARIEAPEPVFAPPASRVMTAEDLAIPGGPLATAVADFPAELPAPTDASGNSKSHGLLIVGIVATLAVSGGLLAWHPWSGGSATTAAAAESAPPVTTATKPPAPPTVASGKGAPLAVATGKPATPVAPYQVASAINVDSAATKPQEETVIAAIKPNFSGAVNVPAADLGLGREVRLAATVAVVSPVELTRRLDTSERQAEQELQSRLAAADFRGVFAGDRLATTDGVAGARSAWGAGAEAIRQFRTRVARLEQAYEDSVLIAQRAQKWSREEMRSTASHQSPAEPAEVSQLSDLMMGQVSEALEILAALDGQYELKSNVITFRSPASATRFTGIRGWVEQRMQTWQAIPEGARPRSISAILRALGDGLPRVK